MDPVAMNGFRSARSMHCQGKQAVVIIYIWSDRIVSNITVFKFRGQYLIALWMCVTSGLCIFLGGIWIKRDGALGGGIFLLISLSLIILVGGLILAGRSVLSIDDQCLSRQIFGKTWQKIKWENVSLITAFPVSSMRGLNARGFNIYPTTKPIFRITPSGKITFTDQLENISELIALINDYASQKKIPIKIRKTLFDELKPSDKL